ncbi:MAG TPA: TetR family transcriptional regulator, partial [Nevskiaceae bacterium]|nr:TetR family transcriptional regulator [Nevskiaceae bacterium]
EIAWLEGRAREEIDRAHRRNLDRLQSFLEEGIADGSMRASDPHVVSRAIFGMVSWVPLAGEWVLGSGAAVRANAAAALRDVVTHGIAADRRAAFACALDVRAFAFQPGNAFDRRAAADQKVELLLQTASRLFNRAGIDGVSLDDVTAALGATKGAFYHHLPEKKALVVRCAQRAFDLYDRFADAAETHGRTGLERATIGLHLNVQAQADVLSPLSPLTGLESLPPRMLAQIRKRSAAVEARFEAFGRQGIADGSLRSYDVRTLALAGAGAFGWIPKWSGGAGGPSPRAIADEICALFLRGLRRR